MQDSFLSALVHLEDFDGRSSFSTWLTRIAINSALMKLRKNRGCREILMDEPAGAGDTSPRFEPADLHPALKNSTHGKNDKGQWPEWSVVCGRPFGT